MPTDNAEQLRLQRIVEEVTATVRQASDKLPTDAQSAIVFRAAEEETSE